MSGFDLAREQDLAKRHDEGQAIHLTDPTTGEPAYYGEGDARKPVTITVIGRLSARYRAAEERLSRQLLRRRRASADPKEAEGHNVAMVAACIVTWEGLDLDGQPFPYNPENAEKLLRLAPRLRGELWVAIHDDAAFFTPSSTG